MCCKNCRHYEPPKWKDWLGTCKLFGTRVDEYHTCLMFSPRE
ncbi:MAG: hypothetical protein ACXQTR_04540 [Candidatus Methanospirareceae archaeon]